VRRTARLIALCLTPAIWGLYLLAIRPGLLARDPAYEWVAGPVTALGLALVLAYGLAVILALGLAHWRRWKTLFRPSPGRIIGALLLCLLTPLAVFDWLPLTLGFLLALLAGDVPLAATGLLLAVTAAWYPALCLFIAGTADRLWQVGLFCLMFWAALAAVLLLTGVDHFRFI
jgi:hypothetical protein